MFQRAQKKATTWGSALLAGCLAFAGLSGCCAHSRCENHATCAEGTDTADHPFPTAPVYPRFHPVPTRPVFLPEAIEPAPNPDLVPTQSPSPSQQELRPIEAPPLATVPDDGWHPLSKAAR